VVSPIEDNFSKGAHSFNDLDSERNNLEGNVINRDSDLALLEPSLQNSFNSNLTSKVAA